MTAEDGGSLSALAGPTTDEAMAAEPGSPRMPAPIGVERPRHARRRRNRRRTKWSLAVLIVVVLLSSGLLAAQRVSRPLAQPTLPTDRHSYSLVRGSAPALPWPIAGQAAVAIPSLGYAQQSGLEGPVPIASLTKMATAVVILHDHPVALNASGPSITITAADAAQFDVDLQTDQTNVPLQVGETLTEMQMLEALLNQSADDIAYSIAVWDAGTESAFVTKMNSLATSLGAVHTHYVDASGFQPQSVSTAADSLRIAAAGMAIPAFADVVGMPTVSLPLVGTVHNIVTEVGTNGVHSPVRRVHGAGRLPDDPGTLGAGNGIGPGAAGTILGGRHQSTHRLLHDRSGGGDTCQHHDNRSLQCVGGAVSPPVYRPPG